MSENDDFEVKTGIPIPRPHGAKGPRFPFASMSVGSSFDCPLTNGDVEATRNRICAAVVWRKKTNPGEKYVTRSIHENGSGLIRCWRVA